MEEIAKLVDRYGYLGLMERLREYAAQDRRNDDIGLAVVNAMDAALAYVVQHYTKGPTA